jgi:hypothetical protein
MKRQVAMIVGVLSMGLPQLTQANWGDLFRPFGGTGWVSLAWFDVVGPIPTAVSSHYQDPDDRVTVAVDTGTGAARFVRFLGDGGSDMSFGFLGRTDVAVPGSSHTRIVRMLHALSTTWVVGDAELADGRWIVVFALDENGGLVPDEQGDPWFVFTRTDLSNVEAFAGDAAIHEQGGPLLLEIVGWVEHQVLGRDFGVRVFLDLTAGGASAGTTISSSPASNERWLHLTPVYATNATRCSAILAESDDGPRVYAYDSGAVPSCGTPVSFIPTIPGAPGAALRPQGITAVPDGDSIDLVVALWAESGLLSKPTAYFRTAGLTTSLRAGWGAGGIAYVDAANSGYLGFRGGRLHSDWNNSLSAFSVVSVGSEIGTGGEFGTAHRVRPIRLLPDGSLDASVSTLAHTTTTSRHHEVQDAAVVSGTGRLVAAVGSFVKFGFDFPAARVAMFQGPDDVFFDGFESGDTSAWSTAVP